MQFTLKFKLDTIKNSECVASHKKCENVTVIDRNISELRVLRAQLPIYSVKRVRISAVRENCSIVIVV